MLFQFGALFTDMSVFDNVAFQMREHTDLPEDADPRPGADEAATRWACAARTHLMPSELSGGMARRVALARAIALDPMLMHVRRALRRARPDLARRGRPADPPAERRARRHLDRRHPRRRTSRCRSSTTSTSCPRAGSSPRARRTRSAPPADPLVHQFVMGRSRTARCRSTIRRRRYGEDALGRPMPDAASCRACCAASAQRVDDAHLARWASPARFLLADPAATRARRSAASA
ncbi:MAG: hypothetical protein MZW92_18160 [Comamonadaceae bacterium]|nr:hypothetical protein [Comamonadaceae bacterium]